MSGVKEIRAMKKILSGHHFFKNYRIIMAAGDNAGEGGDTLGLVKRIIGRVDQGVGAEKKFSGTITLSCGKLNTGVSVPEWGSIFFLSDIQSVQEYWQTAFRAKTMDQAIEKEECYIFDFNPHRALNMMYDYALETTKTKGSTVGTIAEFLGCMRVLAYSGAELEEKSVEEILKEIVRIGSDASTTIKRFKSDWLLTRSLEGIDEKTLEILKKVDPSKPDNLGVLVLSKSGTGKGKTKAGVKIGGSEKEYDPNIFKSDFLNRLRTVTAQIPTFMFISEGKEKSIQDVVDTEQPELFKSVVGITVEDFAELLEAGLINGFRLNKAIEAFFINEDEGETVLERLENKKKLLGFLNAHSSMEIMTPAGLVEEILDKLPMEVWRKDIKICDPCLKSGIFLIEAAIRLIKQFGLENYKYILDNNLYGYCDSARVKQLVEACFGQEMPNIKIIEGI